MVEEQAKRRRKKRRSDSPVRKVYISLMDVVRSGTGVVVEDNKLNVVGKLITSIGPVPDTLCDAVSVLYLSRNSLKHLSGLEQFHLLQVLSLQGNLIDNYEALAPIQTLRLLRVLSLADNPICINPNYRSYVIHHLPHLETLDSTPIAMNEKKNANLIVKQDKCSQNIVFSNHCHIHQLRRIALILQLHSELLEKSRSRESGVEISYFLRFWSYEASLTLPERSLIQQQLRRMVQRAKQKIQIHPRTRAQELLERVAKKDRKKTCSPAENLWTDAYAQIIAVQQGTLVKLRAMCEQFQVERQSKLQKVLKGDPVGRLYAEQQHYEKNRQDHAQEREHLIQILQSSNPPPASLTDQLPPQQIDPDVELRTPPRLVRKVESPLNRCGQFSNMTLNEAINKFEFRTLTSESEFVRAQKKAARTPPRKVVKIRSPEHRARSTSPVRGSGALYASYLESQRTIMELSKEVKDKETELKKIKGTNDKLHHRLEVFQQQNQETAKSFVLQLGSEDTTTNRLKKELVQLKTRESEMQQQLIDLSRKLRCFDHVDEDSSDFQHALSTQERFERLLCRRIFLKWNKNARQQRILQTFRQCMVQRRTDHLLVVMFDQWMVFHHQNRKIRRFQHISASLLLERIFSEWAQLSKLTSLYQLANKTREYEMIQSNVRKIWITWKFHTQKSHRRRLRLHRVYEWKVLRYMMCKWKKRLRLKRLSRSFRLKLKRKILKTWQDSVREKILVCRTTNRLMYTQDQKQQWKRLRRGVVTWLSYVRTTHLGRNLTWKARLHAFRKLQSIHWRKWRQWHLQHREACRKTNYLIRKRMWNKWRYCLRSRERSERNSYVATHCAERLMTRLMSRILRRWREWNQHRYYQKQRQMDLGSALGREKNEKRDRFVHRIWCHWQRFQLKSYRDRQRVESEKCSQLLTSLQELEKHSTRRSLEFQELESQFISLTRTSEKEKSALQETKSNLEAIETKYQDMKALYEVKCTELMKWKDETEEMGKSMANQSAKVEKLETELHSTRKTCDEKLERAIQVSETYQRIVSERETSLRLSQQKVKDLTVQLGSCKTKMQSIAERVDQQEHVRDHDIQSVRRENAELNTKLNSEMAKRVQLGHLVEEKNKLIHQLKHELQLTDETHQLKAGKLLDSVKQGLYQSHQLHQTCVDSLNDDRSIPPEELEEKILENFEENAQAIHQDIQRLQRRLVTRLERKVINQS